MVALTLAIAVAAAIGVIPLGAPIAAAAEVFADGFETGDLSGWTRSSGLAVQTQQVFAGTYGVRNTSSSAWASRSLPDELSQVSMAYEGRFAARSSGVILQRLAPASGPWSVQLLVNKRGRLAYRNKVANVTRVSGEVLATGRWYSLEMRATVAGSSGSVEVLLDGVPIPELSRVEDLGTALIAKVEIGNRPTGRSYDIAIDDVVVHSEGGGGGGGCPADWAAVQAPSSFRALTGVSAIAEDDAWAVGFLKGTQAAPSTAHWNGSTWRSVSVPSVGDYRSAFNAVDAVSSTNAWAVGYLWNDSGESSGKAYRTVTQRWNGSTWNVVTSPNDGTGSNVLVDVDARSTTDAWAVGYRMDGDVKETLSMHWDGSAWRLVPTPSPGTASNSLTAVVAVAAEEVWAVGYQGNGQGYEPLVLLWNGVRWTEQDVGALSHGNETILTGVAAIGSGDVWVVGYRNGAGGYRAMSGHLASGTWEQVAVDDPGGALVITQDVAVASDGSLWSAGFRHGDQPNSETTLLERHADGVWDRILSPNISPVDNALFGISGTPGGARLWAVGRADADALIVTACPDQNTAVAAAGPDSAPDAGLRAGSAHAGSTTPPAPMAVAAAAAIDVVAADVAAAAGLRFAAHTFPPTVFDSEGDGWPDVMLNRHYEEGSGLHANRGDGSFELVQTFPRLDRHGCDAGDVNGDDLVDLYCTTGANYGTDAKANELWVQTGTGWEDRAAAARLLDPFGRGRNAVFLDADRDGDLDLYVGNIRERGDGLPSPNRFFLSVGASYEPGQAFGLDAELRVGCARTADFDGDLYPDLLVCTNAGPKLYRNDEGRRFVDVAPALAPGLRGSDGVFADVNGDRKLDIIMVQGAYVRIWIQGATGTFTRRASIEQVGVRKVAAGDVNRDGLADLYVLRGSTSSSGNAPDVMLVNGGGGLTYSPMTIPGSPGGTADSVEPIDYDLNGQMDFLVMNGDGLHNAAGYTQLIAFFPA